MTSEQLRLAALQEYQIMDTLPEQAFDDLACLTSVICGTPIALVTLLDSQRQWFKAVHGLSTRETPLEHAFCAHAIHQEGVFLVPDARLDPRFSANPLVSGEPRIRFYAGAPLITPSGVALGTLCAIDRVPRVLTAEQQDALAALARQVIRALEMRRTVGALRVALAEKAQARKEIADLQNLLPICAWCHKVRDDKNFWHKVDHYMEAHLALRFTHGICPECSAAID